MTDEEFAELCSEHPELFFETSPEGDLIVSAPPPTLNGFRNGQLLSQLHAWAESDGRGIASGATGAFVLPSGARRTPSAAWTLKSRIRQLDPEILEGIWHLCPDFVVEIRSARPRPETVRAKMREWIESGVQLAWLIDPENRGVEVYRSRSHGFESKADPESIAGEGLLEGFVLQLAPVWNPLG